MSTATSSFYGRKKGSDELDVFEAARYYSGHNEQGSSSSLKGGPSHWRTRRMSLDEHVKQPSLFLSQGIIGKQITNNKEQRQPRSPGRRLASFLNSLFNQSNSKKKKKSNKSGCSGSGSMLQPSAKECEDPDRRRRRSSMSHFRSSTPTNVDGISNLNRSNYCNTSSSNVTTPIKSYKDLRSLLDHRKVDASNPPISSTADKMKNGLSSDGGKSSLLGPKSPVDEDKGSRMQSSRKFDNNEGPGSKESTFSDQEGWESDSSSDLFELQIDGGSYCSSDLPVYETTNIERIGIRAPPI